MNTAKLTNTQIKVLSDILNKAINGETINLKDYSKKVTNKLIELGLIINDIELPSEKAIKTYLLNLKRDTVLTNNKGESISLYKQTDKGWDFIWFMTKGKAGGGAIDYEDLIKEYKID